MSDRSIAPVACVRCGTSMTGQYHYLGALGPLCRRCANEQAAANRAAYQAVPACGAETDCESRIRELEAEVERLRTALTRLLDANATREHEGMPRDEWDQEILLAEEALEEEDE